MRPYADVFLTLKSLVNMTQRSANECISFSGDETLSCVQVFLLDYLFHQTDRPVYQRDLESVFCIRRSSVTGILNHLEQRDLIQRQSVRGDARLKRLLPTEKALRLQPEITALLESIGEAAFLGVTDEELLQFSRIAEKLRSNLVQMEELHKKGSESML
ncbi:MarR family transcriptional regulator [Anaerotignum lactatifermentans]|uniref:MarR family transcriptional regulator n=1 Tax=Anaerotignum lactatifermentans TaxID=160404 RepID=A0ABS2GDS8_9FIRM|nr:MarR family transcriptional regulator [Anaerotignum lactatifermentans]MBM6830223.1 MarR family transcriptional regulator [Anaerotignum lactatifermentans]MBM6878772.1 MarR family transcriptional regulator [Anaerotignum lactatifermentans]MBM6951836.1 MarR family transcriptional regulator [Anaerotignum lactatifermentans]